MISYSKTADKYYHYTKEITREEYETIKTMIDNKPIAPNGYGYKLSINLEWELYELPPMEIDEEQEVE